MPEPRRDPDRAPPAREPPQPEPPVEEPPVEAPGEPALPPIGDPQPARGPQRV